MRMQLFKTRLLLPTLIPIALKRLSSCMVILKMIGYRHNVMVSKDLVAPLPETGIRSKSIGMSSKDVRRNLLLVVDHAAGVPFAYCLELGVNMVRVEMFDELRGVVGGKVAV